MEMTLKRQNTYSHLEEIINSITHGLGLVISLAVCIFFLAKGCASDSWIPPLSLVLYLIGVCSSYASSTIYHSISASRVKAKAIARKFDHAAIYWHIAGSYSPMTLIGMRDGGETVWAWVIFGFVWLCALIGTGLSFRKMKAQSYLETSCYVLLGLTILVAFKPFYETCGLSVVLWVAGEGVAYITGAILYSFKKVRYIHSVFHIFVILGDICHIIAIWKILQMFIIA